MLTTYTLYEFSAHACKEFVNKSRQWQTLLQRIYMHGLRAMPSIGWNTSCTEGLVNTYKDTSSHSSRKAATKATQAWLSFTVKSWAELNRCCVCALFMHTFYMKWPQPPCCCMLSPVLFNPAPSPVVLVLWWLESSPKSTLIHVQNSEVELWRSWAHRTYTC